MKATLEASPIPNHSTIMGRKASGGMGRSISNIGSTRCSRSRERPSAVPTTMPRAAAMPKPHSTRERLAGMCWGSSPEGAILMPGRKTSPGSGRRGQEDGIEHLEHVRVQEAHAPPEDEEEQERHRTQHHHGGPAQSSTGSPPARGRIAGRGGGDADRRGGPPYRFGFHVTSFGS